MAFSEDELFDILNEDGTRTGRTKPRGLVHQDGDLHGASHVFLTRQKNGRIQLLLQKRSADKDSYPLCWDTSAAGHLDAGESFDSAAIRELWEELGVTGSIPKYLFTRKQDYTAYFHGKPFHDHEINAVYLLELDRDASAFSFEKSEIDAVRWSDLEDILSALRRGAPSYCLNADEIEQLRPYLEKHYQ